MPLAGQRTFSRLHAEGQQALLNGTHRRESQPAEGSSRWGIGAVLRPDPAAAHVIGQAAIAAAAIIGEHHWLAGAAGRSHLTLHAGIEPYRPAVPPADPMVPRYAAALRSAATGIGPIRFTVTGITLTPISVMACAAPVGTAADDLAAAFSAALSAQGCGGNAAGPGIWYLNLVYYTGPVRSPHALIDWVDARRQTKITDLLVTGIQLVRWRYTSAGMTPVVLAAAVPPAR